MVIPAVAACNWQAMAFKGKLKNIDGETDKWENVVAGTMIFDGLNNDRDKRE